MPDTGGWEAVLLKGQRFHNASVIACLSMPRLE